MSAKKPKKMRTFKKSAQVSIEICQYFSPLEFVDQVEESVNYSEDPDLLAEMIIERLIEEGAIIEEDTVARIVEKINERFDVKYTITEESRR